MDSDEAETRLWLFAADGSGERPLTTEGQSASSPVFSPDGKQLAFVARRGDDKAGQIYLISMDGPGEARRLTSGPVGAGGLKWAGEHISVVANVGPGKGGDERAARLEAGKDSKGSAPRWPALLH